MIAGALAVTPRTSTSTQVNRMMMNSFTRRVRCVCVVPENDARSPAKTPERPAGCKRWCQLLINAAGHVNVGRKRLSGKATYRDLTQPAIFDRFGEEMESAFAKKPRTHLFV
jgi:hypothetical protein